MRQISIVLAMTVGVVVLASSRLQAEDNPFSTRKSFAFNPAPQSECDWHMITEASVLYQLGRSIHYSQSARTLLSWQLGFMANTTKNQAWGGALQFGVGDNRARFGVGPVYRHWLKRRSFVDLSSGLIIGGQEEDVSLNGSGWYAQAGFGIAGRLSMVTRVEVMPLRKIYYSDAGTSGSAKRATMFYGGINIGGEQGAILCTLSAAVAAIVVISFINHPESDYAPSPY